MPAPLNRLSEKTKDWAAWFKQTSEHQVSWHGDPPRELRWKLIAGAGGATFIFGWIGFQLLTSNFNTSDLPSALVPNNGLAVSDVAPSASGTPKQTAVILNATSFDPLGDNKENDGALNAVFDADFLSVWTTSTYKNADLGKDGVGVLLDLGTSQPVTQVEIAFEDSGQDVEVYVTDEAEPDLTTAAKLGSVTKSDSVALIESATPVTGRYVLIWLTALPQVSDGFAGGIANVQVLL